MCTGTKQPHKHAELIHAWAEGAKIEWYMPGNAWIGTEPPSWDVTTAYRIKSIPKPDVVVNTVMEFKNSWKTPSVKVSWNGKQPAGYSHQKANIRFIFDGDTDALKSVELI